MLGLVFDFRERTRRRRVREANERLWRELCAAHKLRRAERRLLVRAARDLGLASPALFFLKPSALAAAEERRGDPRGAQRKELKRLRGILFRDGAAPAAGRRGSIGDDGLPLRFAPDELAALPPWGPDSSGAGFNSSGAGFART